MKNLLYGVSISLLLLTFCTPRIHVPDTASWYTTAFTDSLPKISLSGRTILLDPGHGNLTSGSIGVAGVKESVVNLAVSLQLKRLLEERAATVFLTRDADTTWRWSPNVNARDDLANRCRFRDSLMPDLFISIHHNGSKDGSRNVNGSQVFYAMEDPGASLDLAAYVNREISLLGMGPSYLTSGNYFILRTTPVPSILGEASYLSHPVMEQLLSDSVALSVEAAAYFRGIVRWFASGVPKIASVTIDTAENTITSSIKTDVPLCPSYTAICLDGTQLTGKLLGNRYVAALSGPLANGTHNIVCKAGNSNGNYAPQKKVSLFINRKAHAMFPSWVPLCPGATVRLQVKVVDAYGIAVIDGKEVVADGGDTARTVAGSALLYVKAGAVDTFCVLTCDSICDTVTIRSVQDGAAPVQGFVVATGTALPPTGCILSYEGGEVPADRNGFFSFNPQKKVGDELQVSATAPGFQLVTALLKRGSINRIETVMYADALLFGKKIMVDPEHGGSQSGGISSTGVRASDCNRKIALLVAGFLREYGAQVLFARTDDRTVDTTERVFASENPPADLYLVIRTNSNDTVPYISWYPGSEKGGLLAHSLVDAWNRTTGNMAQRRAQPDYIMQQTRCPAVTIALGSLCTPGKPATAEAIAKTVRDGVVAFYQTGGYDGGD